MTGQAAKTKKIFDGRYEILSIVGRGARSVVYHARHVSSPKSEVALKVLIDQKGKNPSAERLRREALAMVSCRHRYVARLDDFHSVGSLCYLAMEFAPESDLRNFVGKHGGKLSIEQAERFLKQSAEGMAFIHRAGIIHRDIKPENILVMNEKEVRITDFGVALLPGEECSIADLQSGVGTMNYMAPEILEGRPADQRSDLYALGVVFYELLGGQNPFQGSPLAKQIDVRKNENFQPLTELDPNIPKYLSDLILQCMRYDLDQRFNNCDELLANLLNKKSDNFSKEQKVIRSKPARPKTNNIHKRPRKAQNKVSAKENEDLFDEFDRLLAEDGINASETSSESIVSNQNQQTGVEATIIPEADLEDEGETETHNQDQQNPTVSADSNDIFSDEFSTKESQESEQVISDSVNSIENDADYTSDLAQQISADSSLDDNDDYIASSHQRLKSHQIQQSSRKSWITMILGALILIAIIPGLRNSLFGVFHSGIKTLKFWETTATELPLFESAGITFPKLPQGVFSGSLEGALPGRSIPISLISFGESGKIAILLGIDGWQPIVADINDLIIGETGKTLKINSNGILLEMNAEITDGKIVGYFSNLINGTQGQWSVEPAI